MEMYTVSYTHPEEKLANVNRTAREYFWKNPCHVVL